MKKRSEEWTEEEREQNNFNMAKFIQLGGTTKEKYLRFLEDRMYTKEEMAEAMVITHDGTMDGMFDWMETPSGIEHIKSILEKKKVLND